MAQQRILIHFPGFEPLDALQHKERMTRSAAMSAKIWGFTTQDVPFSADDDSFILTAKGTDWETQTQCHIVSIAHHIKDLSSQPLWRRCLRGYSAFATIIASGGFFAYCRHAWRFAGFFLFPFLLFALGVCFTIALATAPLWSQMLAPIWLPITALASGLLFYFAFLPLANKLYTLLLFDDWTYAHWMADFDRAEIVAWVEAEAARLTAILQTNKSNLTVTAHSMGGVVAIHVLGIMLEKTPALFAGRKVTMAPMGGALLQSAVIAPATKLRARTGLVAKQPSLTWVDVQCLTDPMNFYRCDPVALSGHKDAPASNIFLIRFKHMLTKEHYKRMKFDILRMHRQFMIGPDCQSPFDYGSFVFGPLAALDYITASKAKSLPEHLC